MGSLEPPPASFLLPPLTPAMDAWFISSASDQLLTQALTRELHSTSASSSCSSGCSVDHVSPSFEQSNKYSDGLHFQSQSSLSQLPGSPLSSDSVCKEQPESPFTNGSSIFGMSTPTMVSLNSITESCLPHHQAHAPKKGSCTKALQAPSSALSSQAAAGAGASKVSKRRSRSSKKPPIAVLSTDTSNFRAMVQQLTGIPAPPQPLSHLWGTSGVPLLKPQPTRLSPLDLTTLDTSMSFLAPKINPFLQTGHNALSGILGSSYYSNMINYDALLSSSSTSMGTNGNCATGDFKHFTAASVAKEGGQSVSAGPSSASIESFLMNDEDQNLKVSYNTIDSWLTFDGGALANQSPRVDLTKIAS